MTERDQARADPVGYLERLGQNWGSLPQSLRHGFALWYLFGAPAGSFLQAVIENDLTETFGAADVKNLNRLHTIVAWFYNHADTGCIKGNAPAWAESGGYIGQQEKGGD